MATLLLAKKSLRRGIVYLHSHAQPGAEGSLCLHSINLETPENHILCVTTCICRQEEDEMYYHSDDELLREGDTISQGSLNARYTAQLHLGLPFGLLCWKQ